MSRDAVEKVTIVVAMSVHCSGNVGLCAFGDKWSSL